MNLTGFERIHHSNLEHGKEYFLKNKWGEAMVKPVELTHNGWQVEIVKGGFSTPVRKYNKGDIILVGDEVANFYEPKG